MEADHGQADGFAMLAGEVDNSWKPPLNGACTSTLAGADRQRSLALRIGADRQRQGALRMCIPAVLVYDSGEMAFHVTWRVEKLPIGSNGIKKESDVGNRNMYVLDNLGNRYDHIALDGAARDGGTAGYGSDLSGAFLFPPAQPGAFRFQFVDADQGVAIANIDLRPPAP